MNARDVVARLEAVEPLRLQAIDLILQLDRVDLTAYDQVVAQEVISDAISELNHHTEGVEKVTKRCSNLCPIPGKATPPGF